MNQNISKEILLSLKKGDHKAFEYVFTLYFNKVKFFINKIIRSEENAEELAQDIFVKLWQNRDSLRVDKSFAAYLFTVARNTTYNFLKHELIKESYAQNNVLEVDFVNVEDEMYAEELMLLIEMNVNKMPEQRRRIYEMSRNEGLTNDEISEHLGIAKKTVENQLSLALKDLKKAISFFVILIFFSYL